MLLPAGYEFCKCFLGLHFFSSNSIRTLSSSLNHALSPLGFMYRIYVHRYGDAGTDMICRDEVNLKKIQTCVQNELEFTIGVS